MRKRISLVISDVDGTLVTPDKRLTDASVRAVRLPWGTRAPT
jgi:hydroxymethylpyrimidine pyrophosphatase-like HAD family hydrolase